MKRVRSQEDYHRALALVNYCNTQVLNMNEQSIIRALFDHATSSSENGDIESLEQLASEAHISPASVSRFVRKAGYPSFANFRETFSRQFDDLAQRREAGHALFMQGDTQGTIADRIFERSLANVLATMNDLDQDLLSDAVRALSQARSVLILGDDHALSDFFTFQLDLLAYGVSAYLHKNVEAQKMQANMLGAGDALLFVSVSESFVTPDQWQMLQLAHGREGVTTICLCQDGKDTLAPLADNFISYGIAGSQNHGFASLWMLSEIMSELIYEI